MQPLSNIALVLNRRVQGYALGLSITLLWSGSCAGYQEVMSTSKATPTRNEQSTPRNLVLPSSRALAYDRLEFVNPQKLTATEVSSVQAKLARLGFNVPHLDGSIDGSFMAAVVDFQERHHLHPTGVLDVTTVRMIRNAK
jgi:hypothetical protein